MVIKDTTLPDAKIIIPKVYKDSRGYFFESYQFQKFKENGILENFVQDNEVESKKGVLRGLHYQLKYPQSKLVRVIKGDILDVAVDIRKGSKTFGKSKMIHLSSENKKMFYIPHGYAHGYLVLSDIAIVQYKCTEYYRPDDQFGIIWNDKTLNLNWGIDQPILSYKDSISPDLNNQKKLPIF